MELSETHVFDAPIDAVVAMFADADAVVTKYEGMGHRDVEILECGETDGVLRVRSRRVVDVDLPGFARKVLKPTNTMVQTDEWRRRDGGGLDGTFTVEVQGAPVSIAGSMRLRPDGQRTTEEVTISVKVNVPLVGGKIADWAAKNDVKRTLDAEFAFGDAWLAGRGG